MSPPPSKKGCATPRMGEKLFKLKWKMHFLYAKWEYRQKGKKGVCIFHFNVGGREVKKIKKTE